MDAVFFAGGVCIQKQIKNCQFFSGNRKKGKSDRPLSTERDDEHNLAKNPSIPLIN